MEEKIAGDELNVVQGLYHELQMVQAKLQGALSVLAAIYQIPEGGSIDPLTGEIKRPAALTLSPSPAGEGNKTE